ncbi:CDP-diacylglycerol--glycerol-3-phosphate 3-phosphatidyltransferase [Mycoplasmatota bacterium]|nr:CDP-diacylglycerol--glycerol-3-phosphate 3-phosphatidyltransferase [Mycoplasmatota bacterium]
MNVPNLLTVIRLFLIPIFILVFFSTLENHLVWAVFIFILAGTTDVLDGYIARKYNLVTKWGQVMDPLADKLMQLTVLTCLTIEGYIPIWIVIVYGIKEFTMIFGGIFLYTKKEKIVIPANFFGKVSTLTFYLAVLSLVLDYNYSKYVFMVAISFAILAFIKYSVIGSNRLKQLKNDKS